VSRADRSSARLDVIVDRGAVSALRAEVAALRARPGPYDRAA